MTDHIRAHLRAWLTETGTSMAKLDRLAGLGEGYTTKLFKQSNCPSPRTYAKYAAFVTFPPECEEEMLQHHGHVRASKEANMPLEPLRQPWVVTVARLKEEKPVYARAWA